MINPQAAVSINLKYDEIHAALLDRLENAIQLGRASLTASDLSPLLQGPAPNSQTPHQAVTDSNGVSASAQQGPVMMSLPANAHNSHAHQSAPTEAANWPIANEDDPLPQSPVSMPQQPTINRHLSRKVFRKWYDQHAEHPFPDGKTFIIFVELTGLELDEITCWFRKERAKNGVAKSSAQIAAPLFHFLAGRPF